MPYPFKIAAYYAFAEWIATPAFMRDPKTQVEFGEKHDVSEWTLCSWKNDPDFYEDVRRSISKWLKDAKSTVIGTVLLRASMGDLQACQMVINIIDKVEGSDLNAERDFRAMPIDGEDRKKILAAFSQWGLAPESSMKEKESEPSKENRTNEDVAPAEPKSDEAAVAVADGPTVELSPEAPRP